MNFPRTVHFRVVSIRKLGLNVGQGLPRDLILPSKLARFQTVNASASHFVGKNSKCAIWGRKRNTEPSQGPRKANIVSFVFA